MRVLSDEALKVPRAVDKHAQLADHCVRSNVLLQRTQFIVHGDGVVLKRDLEDRLEKLVAQELLLPFGHALLHGQPHGIGKLAPRHSVYDVAHAQEVRARLVALYKDAVQKARSLQVAPGDHHLVRRRQLAERRRGFERVVHLEEAVALDAVEPDAHLHPAHTEHRLAGHLGVLFTFFDAAAIDAAALGNVEQFIRIELAIVEASNTEESAHFAALAYAADGQRIAHPRAQ